MSLELLSIYQYISPVSHTRVLPLTSRLDLRSQYYALLTLRSKRRVRVGQDRVESLHKENLICLFKFFTILGKELVLFDRRRGSIECLCKH